jgi:hypothetical protein
LANLIEVRDSFFPRLRHILTAPEAKCLFGNWAELIGCAVSLKAALEDAGGDVVPVLLEELPKLKEPYSKYCQGIPAAQVLTGLRPLRLCTARVSSRTHMGICVSTTFVIGVRVRAHVYASCKLTTTVVSTAAAGSVQPKATGQDLYNI